MSATRRKVELRVLVVAPLGADAGNIAAALLKEGIDAVIKRLETQNASGKPDPNLKAAGKTSTAKP